MGVAAILESPRPAEMRSGGLTAAFRWKGSQRRPGGPLRCRCCEAGRADVLQFPQGTVEVGALGMEVGERMLHLLSSSRVCAICAGSES